jgi:anthranilate synthase/aminodeoxychorismate synthase-like glutamine amidotransferase
VILLIDNFDSFTYNLYQMIEELGHSCLVIRNNALTGDEIEALRPTALFISPGPGQPEEAGISLSLIDRFAGQIPIFGVCLGHQIIGQAFGGNIIRAPQPRHGKISKIFHHGTGVFAGMQNPFSATRYHSLIVDRRNLPSCLEVTCETDDGLVMGLRHKHLQIEGVQFHPESIATEGGRALVQNFFHSMPIPSAS